MLHSKEHALKALANRHAEHMQIKESAYGTPTGAASTALNAPSKEGNPESAALLHYLRTAQMLVKEDTQINESVVLTEAGIATADDNDPKYGTDEVSRINYQFDNVFKNSFTNPYLIVNAVSAILERFSIQMPVIDPSGRNEVHVLHIHQEEGDLFVYIAIERNGRGHYDAFVQLVDKEGLSVLQSHDEVGKFNTGNDGDRFNTGILKTSRRTDDF